MTEADTLHLPKKKQPPVPPPPEKSEKTTNDMVEDLIRSMLVDATASKDTETKLKVAKHAMQWEAIKVKTSMANKWGADLMGDPAEELERDDE